MSGESEAEHPTAVIAPADLVRLQGLWVSIAGRRAAEFVVEGQQFTFRFHDGDVYTGGIDVVTDEWPRTMVMWIADGPAKHKGKTAVCIYELDGDRLRWCPSEPGADDPPAEFPAVDDPHALCILFRRETPTAKEQQ